MSETKRKIYGIPLTDDHDNCFGITVDQNGRYVGRHTSSNYSFLKMDLWKDPDAEYVFSEKPKYEQLCFLLFSIVSGFEDEIEQLKTEIQGWMQKASQQEQSIVDWENYVAREKSENYKLTAALKVAEDVFEHIIEVQKFLGSSSVLQQDCEEVLDKIQKIKRGKM